MNLIITGGTGYIASNFLRQVPDPLKQKIYVLDRTLKLDNIGDSKKQGITLLEFDLNDTASLYELNKIFGDEENTFVHCANLKSLDQESRFLEALREADPSMYFVYLSSAAVYGEAESQRPLTETSPAKPISAYGEHKLGTENLVQSFFNKHLIMRIANPYGKETDVRGIHGILMKMINGFTQEEASSKPFEFNITADRAGQVIRDFIYIDDLCRMIANLIKNCRQGIFNLGSGIGVSLEDFVSRVCREHSIEPKMLYQGYKDGDIKYSVLDVSKFYAACLR
jgi:UDP-glucose 4-epimerase